MAVEVELFDDLGAVERDAGGALDRSARTSLFERLDWFRLIERHCPPPGKLLVVRAQEQGCRAWLFLKVDGGKAVGLASWYSFDFGAILDCGDRHRSDRLTGALVAGLRGHRPTIAAVELSPLAASDGLRAAFADRFWLCRLSPATTGRRMNTSGQDFASYWAARPSRLRNSAERKASAAGLDIRIHKEFSEAAWTDYEQVYAASWKPAEGSPDFLRALAGTEGVAGTLRLGIARKDGRPVAAQLWLVEGGVATIHVGSSRVDLQACKLEYSIVSPK